MPIPETSDRYQGFSLQSVCWGYRDIFQKAIEGLFEEGLIGPGRREISAKFFGLLKRADQSSFDYVLKEFLGAINPGTRWILDLPGIFSDVTDLGREIAEHNLYHGISYFRVLGEGGFGGTPEQVRNLMDHLMRLRDIDPELAFAFMKGYRHLIDRLSPAEIERYVHEGLRIYQSNRQHSLGFMEGTAKSSENIIRSITRECRLVDVEAPLSVLLRALVGYEVEVADLGHLDADHLVERGTSTVCMYRWLYMPLRIRHFEDLRRNRNWYLLTAVVAAGMLSQKSFCSIHGHPGYATCADLVGGDALPQNLLQIVEYVRVITAIKRQWPGARRLLDVGLRTEFSNLPPATPAEHLLHDCLMPDVPPTSAAERVRDLAAESANVFHTASLLDGETAPALLRDCPGLDLHPLRAFGFLPDFLYPGQVESAPQSALVADLKEEAERKEAQKKEEDEEEAAADSDSSGDEFSDGEAEEEEAGIRGSFVYDEWCHTENDYYEGYCFLNERTSEDAGVRAVPTDIDDEVRRVRQVFERLKPDLVRKEKRLPDGDDINFNLLVDYLVKKRHEPSPKIDFYEKPLTRKRDLAVLILLDVSGSTSEDSGGEKVLDIEKRAAMIFGQGLNALGDRFSICGFSGNGREHCEYFVYKDFGEPWGPGCIGRLMGAHPSNATRIGVALRHAGYRLSHQENRQRLLILITDGKPMDSDYDPNTRYAQYDVRKACEENARLSIHTFAISTEENSRADMEIMFPRGRFVILPDLSHLPKVLPRLYIQMTV